MKKKAIVFDIVRSSFVDGDGIRTTVFFKGCNMRCKWCHNPEGLDKRPQMLFYKNRCKACGKCNSVCGSKENCTLCGKCALLCPNDAREICGKEYTKEELFDEIVKDGDEMQHWLRNPIEEYFFNKERNQKLAKEFELIR